MANPLTRAERVATSVVEAFALATQRDWSANDHKLHRMIVRALAAEDTETAALRARVAQVEAAASAFVAKLDECQPHIDGAFVLAHVHGHHYNGPSYGAELSALRTALTPAPAGEETKG